MPPNAGHAVSNAIDTISSARHSRSRVKTVMQISAKARWQASSRVRPSGQPCASGTTTNSVTP